MIVEANWDRRALLVWGANGGGAAAPAELRNLIGEVSSDGLLAPAAVETALETWLPHDGSGPAFSGRASGDENGWRLAVATVPALRFSALEAVDLLLSLGGPGCAWCGESITYWSKLARFTLSLIARGAVYPSVVRPLGDTRAAWRVLLSREEVGQLERFVAAMPASCRAAANGSADPVVLVETFLETAADALIRRYASSDPFFSRVHTLAADPGASPEMRWTSALLSEDSTVHGTAPELTELSDQLLRWSGRLGDSASKSAWLVGFTLEEPDWEEGDVEMSAVAARWPLGISLHSPEDDETVSAEELWSDDGGTARFFGRNVIERREFLETELRRAAEAAPGLASVLQGPEPWKATLSTAESHQFLRQWSNELRGRGFMVLVPDWASDAGRSVGLIMSLRPEDGVGGDDEEWVGASGAARRKDGGAFAFDLSAGRVGLDSVLRFDWRVAVGGATLTPAEFEAMVGQQSPLVRYQGKWVEIDVEAARSAAAQIEAAPEGTITLAEAFRTAYGLGINRGGDRGGSEAMVTLEGKSWVHDLLEQAPESRMQELPQPTTFAGTLRPYQLRGLGWMMFLHRLGIGGCLADDMGLGKTIQLIALLLHEREQNPEKQPGPTLLFAPTSVVGNWIRELERFAPSLRLLLHHGPARLKGAEFAAAANETDIVITSYALAHRDSATLAKVGWHRLALDEAQKVKNPSAASSIAIRGLGATHRLALTGTPIENHLSELWSIMDLLNPGLLGSARDFRDRFAVPIEKLADHARAKHLKRMIRPFVLRRTKTDPELAGDLPEKMEMKVFCSLTVEQAAMYERIASDMLGQIDEASGIRRRGLILAVLTRLKQLCDHPQLVLKDSDVSLARLEGRSGKCERLVEMLDEVLEEGESALVFTQYREMGHLLEKMLAARLGTSVQFLHGGTPQKGRDDMVAKFQDPNGGVRIFILSLRAGGLGLNLTAASHVFHFDRWWNPAVEAQATDRAHRIGQTKKVQVHKYISMGTVEERIDQLLSDKMQLADNIVGSGDEWLTNLSTSELREYLTLSRQAVAEF